MSTVLITGAGGVLGRALVAACVDRGDSVATAQRGTPALPGQSAFELDVTEREPVFALIEALAPDVVFHLAGLSARHLAEQDPERTRIVNVEGTRNVIDAVARTGTARLVFASSSHVYAARGSRPVDERGRLDFRAAYGGSKAIADRLVRVAARQRGLPAVTIRSTNVFGPGDVEPSRLAPQVLAAVAAGEPLVLRSDGSALHQFLHADDAARAYLLAADALAQPGSRVRGAALNIAGAAPLSVLEFASAAARVAGIEPVFEYIPDAEVGPQPPLLDTGRAECWLGWRPEVAPADGLAGALMTAGSALPAA